MNKTFPKNSLIFFWIDPNNYVPHELAKSWSNRVTSDNEKVSVNGKSSTKLIVRILS